MKSANTLYSAPVDVQVSFGVSEPGAGAQEPEHGFPVYANQGRREQVFWLSADCADERRAVIEGVCGVVRVLE